MLLKADGKYSFLFISVFSLILMSILFFMHKRSTHSIRELQDGNALAGHTFQVNNALQEIVTNINAVEGNILKKTGSDSSVHGADVTDTAIESMKRNINLILELTKNNEDKKNVNKLVSLINNKISFFENITSKAVSSPDARKMLYAPGNNLLNDSIYVTSLSVQLQAENELQKKINLNFKVSEQALGISKALTVLALSAIMILGTIIILHLMRNKQLIKDLELSKQNAQAAANVKEQFLANMSHEIRTPVNSIIGFTNLLQKTTLKTDQENFVSHIKTSGENLLHIVNDILDISKIEAGMLYFTHAPFNVKELCYYIEMMFYNESMSKGIDYKCIIENDVPEFVTGDEVRLKQILTNLISNAFKFTDKGFVHLTVQMKQQENPSPRLVFTVRDSGIGIKQENLDTIFNRFEQADSGITKIYGGTGLGLNIVKKLLQMQGGDISVKSEFGKGTIFTFYIPVQIPDGSTVQQSEESKTIHEHAVDNIKFNSGYKVLAAEDNKMNQVLLNYIFKQWNIDCVIAQNGEEAINQLKQEKFDLILMDIQMPVVDGYTAAEWIRKEMKSKIPIIAMTAFVLQGEKDKCFAHGMNEYFPKPINESKLKQLVAKYLSSSNENLPRQIVNPAYLSKVFSGNKEFIGKVLELFIVQYPTDIESLKAAVSSKDITQIKAMAHHLKTTVYSVNDNPPMIDTLQQLEELTLDSADWNFIQQQVQKLFAIEQEAQEEAKQLLNDILYYQ